MFQEYLLGLDKSESGRLLNTLRKLRQIAWAHVYRDPSLKWEKIDSVKPPKGIDAIYSLRIKQARRATVCKRVMLREVPRARWEARCAASWTFLDALGLHWSAP